MSCWVMFPARAAEPQDLLDDGGDEGLDVGVVESAADRGLDAQAAG